MRAITKGREPTSLTTHRLADHSDYANYAQKDDLREALVRDQQDLCCYCMGRIAASASDMKIEHWRCQSNYPELQLAYRNILGACLGGDGQPENLQHCDTRKGDSDLKWNPAERDHWIEQRVRFERDGQIVSDDVEFNGQLNAVLGLNLAHLRNRRGAVLASIVDWWKGEKARLQGPVPRERLERLRTKHVGAGALSPFAPVVVWWLDQRLTRSAQ